MKNNGNGSIFTFNNAINASICVILCGSILLLGNSASGVTPKSASEAIADIDRVLGDPEEMINDAFITVESFIQNHIGALVVATAFSLGIKSIVK